MTSPILRTKHLTKQFDGVRAVDDLSISIQQGKVTGIVGPNGSGKTTLVNLLTGMFPLSSGVVIVSDTEHSSIKAPDVVRLGITRTFQQVRLFGQMTALDNILIALTERRVFPSFFEKHTKSHIKEAEELLRKVDLYKKKDDNAENLSYGQRKLLEIARALAMKSDIILLDEPYAGLFPEMRKIVSTVVCDLREQGKTVILIEHDMEIISELVDHLIVLDSGKLLAEGKADEVLNLESVKDAYLGD